VQVAQDIPEQVEHIEVPPNENVGSMQSEQLPSAA
jgi:hypothetical protein